MKMTCYDSQIPPKFMHYVGAAVLAVTLLIFVACGSSNGGGASGESTVTSSVVFYGDSRTSNDVHAQLLEQMIAHTPMMIFHAGDMVTDGNDPADWAVFNALTDNIRNSTPFWPALGNHENESPLYFANFDLPGNEQWYIVDRDDVHYVVLDTNVAFEPASEQYQWLENELQNHSSGWLVVFFHHPPYSLTRDEEPGTLVREYLVPLFEQYDVDLVVAGHDHNYQHWQVNGVDYLVTGGGGAPLYDKTRDDPNCLNFGSVYHYCLMTPSAAALHVAVYGLDGMQIDAFDIMP